MTQSEYDAMLAERMAEWRKLACYRVIRFYRDGRKPRTIKNGLTESEAKAHCSREDTHGEGWFDGFDYMKGVKAQ